MELLIVRRPQCLPDPLRQGQPRPGKEQLERQPGGLGQLGHPDTLHFEGEGNSHAQQAERREEQVHVLLVGQVYHVSVFC